MPLCVTGAPPTQPTIWVNHTHTHTERLREGNAQVFLCFCLLSFYYFIPGLVLIHSVCVSGASSSSLPEGERGREWFTCSSCSRPLATSPATLSQSHSQSQSVCRIASHGIASCSSVFTHGHGYTQLTTYTHTHSHTHVGSACVCV